MLIPALLSQKFKEKSSLIDEVGRRVQESILAFCNETGYASSYRKKTIESVAEKIETGRYAKWSELDDLWAATIIIPSLLDENEVLEYCRSTFSIQGVKRRGDAMKPPDAFRFEATRVIARLNVEPSDSPLRTILFEIQIRTAFEHAWSVTTHALAYKTDEVDWRRLRLAAQMKATVEQLDTLILAYEGTKTHIPESLWPETQKKIDILKLIRDGEGRSKIPAEAMPKDISRFCDNVYEILRDGYGKDGVEAAIRRIGEIIGHANQQSFPRSISVVQWIVGEVVSLQSGNLVPKKVRLHVTPELLNLYPLTKGIPANNVFDYEIG
jgi:ppGpp synthetase/RelA/SpoT-type nucleotidyltranferase